MQLIEPKDLQFGDRVLDSEHHEIGVLTVYQIKDGLVHFHRPYTHTSNMVTTGGLICYTGVEEFSHHANDTRNKYHLISRKPVK